MFHQCFRQADERIMLRYMARQRCLNAEMDVYLTKPFQEVKLVSILNKWLKVMVPRDPNRNSCQESFMAS